MSKIFESFVINYFIDFSLSDVIIRNSELLCGSMDKSTMGSGTKSCIFYVILRDFGEEFATRSMWRLARVSDVR